MKSKSIAWLVLILVALVTLSAASLAATPVNGKLVERRNFDGHKERIYLAKGARHAITLPLKRRCPKTWRLYI